MASAAVASKLTIPGKKKHQEDRDELYGKYEQLGKRIGELTTQREEIKRSITNDITNITLDDAIDALRAVNTDVHEFNQQCQNTQAEINANNQALQALLARIKTEIAAEEAKKAAEEAAAAAKTAAEEAAALERAKESLQEYIGTLREQYSKINDNTLDDIAGKNKVNVNKINQLKTELDTAATEAGEEAISQDTREAIASFKDDTGEEVTAKTKSFNDLNNEFNTEKKKVLAGLNERIRALEAVAHGANVTAKGIADALAADKIKKVEDTSLNDIKGRANELAIEIGKKATAFATSKEEILGKIEEDKKLFDEKQKIMEDYQKIMDIFDSDAFKDKERVIQENIEKAQAAETAAKTAALDKTKNIRQKLQANANFGTAIIILGTSILSLETELDKIKDLPKKLQELQKRSAIIQPPPVDIASIQDRLNAANAEYDRLSEAHQARADALSAEKEAASSRSPSPTDFSPKQPDTQNTNKSGRTIQQNMLKDADEKSVPEEKRKPGRRYSIFIPTPVQKKQPPTRIEGAAASNSDNTEDTIDPTVLEIFVYEDDNEKKLGASEPTGAAAGAGARARAGAGAGGGFIQRGGEGNKVAKIIKVKQITPEIQELFLSFQSPNEVLTPQFLEKIEKTTQSTEVVDIPSVIDGEMSRKKDQLINTDDTTDFLSNLGQKASHQTTIEKLMIFLDTERDTNNKPLRPTQNGKTYQDMYLRLWQFMEYTSGSIRILRSVFESKDTTMVTQLLASSESGITKRRSDLTWSSPQNNSLFTTLFMEFSKCYKNGKDDGTYSLFLENQVRSKGAQKYRFMLNWIILIAFHWYYIQKRQYALIDCGEFIEHLYHTYIGWMEHMDSQTLKNVFQPVTSSAIDYKTRVGSLIVSNFKTDGSLESLINGIRGYLCDKDKNGKRESKHPSTKQPKPNALKFSGVTSNKLPPPSDEPPPSVSSDSDSDSESESESVQKPSSVPRPSTPRRLEPDNVLQKISETAQGGVSTTSPSPRQAWMNKAKVGPKTPESQPPESQQPSPPETPPSKKLFTRTAKPDIPVPPLKTKSIQPASGPPATQSARNPQELSENLYDKLQLSLPLSARRQNDKKPSIHSSNVNLNNPAIQPSGGLFPGHFNDKPLNNEVPPGTDLSFLSTPPQQKSSPYALLPNKQQQQLTPKPPPPESNNNNGTFSRRIAKSNPNKGGQKRTRKHRRPAVASTPTPATRRHRVHSSSSQKHTRRRRPHRREH